MLTYWLPGAVLASVALCVPSWGHAAESDVQLSHCSALRSVDFSRTSDALIQVSRATGVEPRNGVAAFCEVEGYVAPGTGFLLRLPASDWNGKFMTLGCYGFCGSVEHIVDCYVPLKKGYACIVTDGGHRSAMTSAAWADRNVDAIVEYLVRATHVTALAGKAIVQAYYARPAMHSYFMGCSGGGEQAMMEAQRFPTDFDGIVAGQPTSEMAANMNLVWGVRAMSRADGTSTLDVKTLARLHTEVVAQCDLNDGVRDGLIGDPRQCHPDLRKLECGKQRRVECLTATQISVVQALYAGPRNSQGRPVSLVGALPGSELSWAHTYQGNSSASAAAEPFRYYGFYPTPGAEWQVSDFDFDRDPQRVSFIEGLISPVNPDLRAFKALGGRLIAYAGWGDSGGMPTSSVDYYEITQNAMGGREATRDFFRLFMIPGMNHCFGGEGAFAVDYLSALEQWVESGQAPDRLIGAHLDFDVLPRPPLEFPLDPVHVTFTRPIFPYPFAAHYRGWGDVNSDSSFEPFEPR